MFTADILCLIEPLAVPPFSALLLYGSYARQEADEASDVDILQVTAVRKASYSRGKVNFTCYTPEQLLTLAKNGAMFARHLALESVALFDPEGFLRTLASAYKPPKTYAEIYKAAIQAIPLVAVDEGEFGNRPRQYSSTASYLLRTYVYAKAFESGAQSFSMQHVANLTGDNRPRRVLMELRERNTYGAFRSVVDLLLQITDTQSFVRRESLEAFVLNMFGVCDLAVILGLRILAGGGELITYPVVRPERWIRNSRSSGTSTARPIGKGDRRAEARLRRRLHQSWKVPKKNSRAPHSDPRDDLGFSVSPGQP